MLLQAAPAFSLTKEVGFFTAFVLVVIALVILVEIEYKRSVEKIVRNQATHENLFDKIEEFRNDFDGDRQAS
jgi:hypothetical protein